jgi:RNA polymerase sigma-70 factor, ECF subfamily
VDGCRQAYTERVEALLKQVAAGDQAAFAVLYDLIAGQVYGLSKRILRSSCQAEEVTQEVLLQVWQTAPRYGPSCGSGATWIMTLAHHRAAERMRSEQAVCEHDEVLGDTDLFDVVVEEVEGLEHRQLRRALDQLPACQRQAIVLGYYAGCTYQTVAQLLDTPLATVTAGMRDGLFNLHDALAATDEGIQ